MKRKTWPLGLGLDLDVDTPSLLDLDSEATDSQDLDLDIVSEQWAEVAVCSKLAHNVMVDLLRPISPFDAMLWESINRWSFVFLITQSFDICWPAMSV